MRSTDLPRSDGRSLRIYLAGPLFNERERSFNCEIAAGIAECAEVFLPQRDGSLLAEMVLAGVDVAVAERRVFQQDCNAMTSSDILVALLDGAHVDEGVAFEVGYMHALGRRCVALQTDIRRALPTGNNPMLNGALELTFETSGSLFDWVRSVAATYILKRA